MTRQLSRETWTRAIKAAHEGEPRGLLELLLSPGATTSHGEPLPDPESGLCFTPLPDEYGLRLAIVRALAFGPWRNAPVSSITDLVTRTGWGKSKPKIDDYQIDMVVLAFDMHEHGLTDGHQPSMESFAEAIGVEVEVLRRRVQARRRARRGT